MKIEIKQDIKLLDFVVEYFGNVSLTKAKKMILYNCFSMQGASLKSLEYVLHKGDTIEYTKYSGGEHIIREKRDISILYEDKDIIIVNKLSNQSVVAYKDKKDNTLLSMTKAYLKKKYHKNDLYLFFAPLDEECGLCLFAKNKLVLQWLENQTNNFKFKICAIVENKLKHKNDKIAFYIDDNKGYYSLGKQDDKGKEKVFLQYTTTEDLSMGDNDYFQIEIEGNGFRKYLNRFLLSSIGNPVYGDKAFHASKQGNKMLRYCVYSIEMLRPSTNKKIKIETSLPRHFTSLAVPSTNQTNNDKQEETNKTEK